MSDRSVDVLILRLRRREAFEPAIDQDAARSQVSPRRGRVRHYPGSTAVMLPICHQPEFVVKCRSRHTRAMFTEAVRIFSRGH